MSLPFQDRHHAGRQLADRLHCYAGEDTVVVALPRGGVPVAYEIAHALRAPLEVFLLRHLVSPDSEPVTFGLVGSGGVRVLFNRELEDLQLDGDAIDEISQRERISLVARERTYRGALPMLDLGRRTALLVDDGLTPLPELLEVIRAVAMHEPRAIVMAVPVIGEAAAEQLHRAVDDLVLIVAASDEVPSECWYRELSPVSHTEVRALLQLVEAEAHSRELARA
jgi:putative phosphoribosyl transferase